MIGNYQLLVNIFLRRNIISINNKIPMQNKQNDEVVFLDELIDRAKPKLERYDLGFPGMKTPMKGGVKPGDLMIIGGPSGHGKSTLAMTMTHNLCKQGFNCLWFTYELTEEEVDEQFISMGIKDYYNVVVPKQLSSGNLAWVK